MTLNRKRVQEIVSCFEQQRILVVGDLMLDRYIYGSVNRISPEAPVPVLEVTHEENMPGGASNVAWNIQALGAGTVVSGFLGEDPAAEDLKSLLAEAGVSVQCAPAVPGARTTVKTRIIAEHQQVVRVDWDNDFGPSGQDMNEFCARLEEEIKASTGVIIEDYGKGVVQQKVVDTVLKAAGEAGLPTGLDPKDNHKLTMNGVTVVTPNLREAYIVAGLPQGKVAEDHLQDESLMKLGKTLMEQWQAGLIVITLGSRGMLLVPREQPVQHIPTRAREVFDVSGAGDTVIAVCLLALASGASRKEAAELANHAAGVVVGKLGTAACSQEELLGCFK